MMKEKHRLLDLRDFIYLCVINLGETLFIHGRTDRENY